MAIARTKAQRDQGLTITQAKAANAGKSDNQLRTESAAALKSSDALKKSAPAGSTDPSTVAALNAARESAKLSGRSTTEGNLANYNTFASTHKPTASSTGSTGGGAGNFSFQYVGTDGKVKTVSAGTESEAYDLATDMDPKSGLMKVESVYSPEKANGITSSSGNARNEETKLGSTITTLSAPGYSTPAKTTKYIDDYERSLTSLLAASERSINSSYDEQSKTTEGEQNAEVGSTSAGLARMGGYLGGSASAQGALLKLSAGHRAELASLESKRQSALTDARTAFADKQFEAAKAKATEAKYYEEQLYNRQQDFFENQRKLLSDDRTQTNQERDDARSVITNIISNSTGQDWEDLSPETQKVLEANATKAGYPVDVIKNMMAKPKAEASRIDQLIKDAAKKGAPDSILSAISEAGSFVDAAKIAAPYIAASSSSDDYTPVSIPAYDEFVTEFIGTEAGKQAVAQIEAAAKTNFTPAQLVIELKNSPDVKAIYDATVAKVQASGGGTSSEPFTPTEKKKLEQAGLLGSTRQKQLDYLYGKEDASTSRIDSLVE